jgi:hypothetical protein
LPSRPILGKSFVVSGEESAQKGKIRSVFSSHFIERCSPLKVTTFFFGRAVSRPAIFLSALRVAGAALIRQSSTCVGGCNQWKKERVS